ncbi:hypothetical protein Z043_125346, partial [Scleropages formosus]
MDVMAQAARCVLMLDAKSVNALKHGINFKKNHEDGKCYIIYKDDQGLRACKNQCKHQGGLFIQDMEDIDGKRTVRCTKHNWKLNVSSMEYVNPPDSFTQDELEVVWVNGGLQLVKLSPADPWNVDPKTPEELEVGEVTVMYLTHACMELKCGRKTMLFDPWLTGPAFARGWWLLHKPPEDSLERLCQADAIYISHMHSDHLSYPTLKTLSDRRPDVPIFVGDTSRPFFTKTYIVPVMAIDDDSSLYLVNRYLRNSGVTLTNITVVPFGIWQNILNTVDCTRPNGGQLPSGVDLMMSDFAGGASGFPMAFTGGKYT